MYVLLSHWESTTGRVEYVLILKNIAVAAGIRSLQPHLISQETALLLVEFLGG